MPPEGKQKLPPKTKDNVVDVSINHLITGFVIVFGGVLAVGTTLIVIRDLSKYKRQKAILSGTLEIVKTILNKKEILNEKN
jgi:hypothetical protein|tara:strand:- start:486 stop:728 length:243 start_codon:yes stop_codon:yes gene_type:complete